jgi:hypothetical protein
VSGLYSRSLRVILPKQITALLDTVSFAWVCGLGCLDGVCRWKVGVVAVLTGSDKVEVVEDCKLKVLVERCW